MNYLYWIYFSNYKRFIYWIFSIGKLENKKNKPYCLTIFGFEFLIKQVNPRHIEDKRCPLKTP